MIYDLFCSSSCDDFECPLGHFPIAILLSAIFRNCGTSCGPSASAELLVMIVNGCL